MPLVYIYLVSLVAILSLIIFTIAIKQKRLKKYLANKKVIEERLKNLDTQKDKLIADYIDAKACHDYKIELNKTLSYIRNFEVPRFDELNNKIAIYENLLRSYERWIDDCNKKYIEKAIKAHDNFFSNIDGKSLDYQQREAVVCDEINNLVVAGAGSGKTLTIVGKVKFLCDIKKVSPKDILLIAFTNKAADEMNTRMRNLNIQTQAVTFHKLGLDIIKSAKGFRPDIYENTSSFVRSFFQSELLSFELIKSLIIYFAYYLNVPADLEEFNTIGEAYEYEKSRDFETLKSKYGEEKAVDNIRNERVLEKKTLQGEKVRSLEELNIANFLFLHGVNYEYEALYPFKGDDKNKKPYRPDFYLPDYDIYIEHFGINRQGRTPWLTQIEEQKYISDMKFKRDFHAKNKTKLIETYSYYFSEGLLFDKLSSKLTEAGVKFKDVNFRDIFERTYDSVSDKYFNEFMKLCTSFILLFKSNYCKVDDLNLLGIKSERYKSSKYFRQRFDVFINIIKHILVSYNDFLESNNMIDFSDMITSATECIKDLNGYDNYKYIIVDEFQDISKGRYRLLKALVDKTQAKLFCVGDDWQSIYRFAGSDISIFTDFDKYFGKAKLTKIERTYRNSQELLDISRDFITKNPLQIKKLLKSNKSVAHPVEVHLYSSIKNTLQIVINKIIETHKNGNILILGRTKFDEKFLEDSGLFVMSDDFGQEKRIKKYSDKIRLNECPEVSIEFMTAHKSKGIEADNVILLNFSNDILGFPNKISDDAVLEAVLDQQDIFRYSEERRLLYVALTRTRNKVYILVPEDKPSEFFREFRKMKNVSVFGESQNDAVNCPKCISGHLVMRTSSLDGKDFLGCSNYPQCDYTLNSTAVLSHSIICPKCGGFMIAKEANGEKFLGCSNYPLCRNIIHLPKRNKFR